MHGDLPGEQWLGLPWARGYEVSSLGRVRSYIWYRERELLAKPVLLSTEPTQDGYCLIALRINRRRIYKRVHILVLTAFRGFPPKGMVGRHLDGNPGNSRLRNLCWGTHQENVDDSIRHGTIARGERRPTAKLSDAKIREAFRLRELGYSNLEISNRFNVHPSLISRVLNRKRWAHVA